MSWRGDGWRGRAVAGVALAVLALAGGARAHQIGISNVRIEVLEEGAEVEIAVKGRDLEAALGLGLVDTERDLVRPEVLEAQAEAVLAYVLDHVAVLREGGVCTPTADPPAPDGDGVLFWIVWDCGSPGGMVYRNRLFHAENPLAIQNVLLLSGDDMVQDLLTAEYAELRLSEPPASPGAVFARYTWSGIEHIFVGYDHIAFLIALLLWARRVWPIIKVVTAFTVAHSITLALAVLDVVNIPAALVEPLIAVSIIWVAVENLVSRNIERRWRITFALGLVHGFGFAGVLRAFGLPSEALGLALAAFNVGVEIGQVAIVGIAVPILLGVDQLGRAGARSPALVRSLSLVIAGLGLYWLLQRTLLA